MLASDYCYKHPTIVGVVFPSSNKTYYYKYYGIDIVRGDTAVVLSPNGYATVTVRSVNSREGILASEENRLKWVVQKVDKSAFRKLNELDERQKCTVYELGAIDAFVGPVFVTGCNKAFTKRDTHTCSKCRREIDWKNRKQI